LFFVVLFLLPVNSCGLTKTSETGQKKMTMNRGCVHGQQRKPPKTKGRIKCFHHDSSSHGECDSPLGISQRPRHGEPDRSHALRRRRLSPECVCPSKPGTFRNRASIIGSVWMDYSAVFSVCQHIFWILCDLSVKFGTISAHMRYFAE
jgi:hypothetical protein